MILTGFTPARHPLSARSTFDLAAVLVVSPKCTARQRDVAPRPTLGALDLARLFVTVSSNCRVWISSRRMRMAAVALPRRASENWTLLQIKLDSLRLRKARK